MRGERVLAAVLMMAASSAVRASDFSPASLGTTGSQFLTIDIGPRGMAMGGAYTAISNDAYSLYWNPAGLARIPRISAALMYSRYVADTNYQSAAYAQRITESSVIGAGWRYQDLGSVNRIDSNDTDRGQFHPRTFVGELGWGQSIYDLSDTEMDLSIGGALRWIHSDMSMHADGYGGDIGVQSRFYTGSYYYDLAATFQNMGRGQNFVGIRDTLPFRARIGTAVYPTKYLIVSLEGILLISNYPAAAVGVEYTMQLQKNMKAMLRAGFNSSTMQDLGPFSAMSMGMGLTVSDFTFDYAYQPYGVLGTADAHRLSVSFNLPSKTSRGYRER